VKMHHFVVICTVGPGRSLEKARLDGAEVGVLIICGGRGVEGALRDSVNDFYGEGCDRCLRTAGAGDKRPVAEWSCGYRKTSAGLEVDPG
jgi:hypothetical protein